MDMNNSWFRISLVLFFCVGFILSHAMELNMLGLGVESNVQVPVKHELFGALCCSIKADDFSSFEKQLSLFADFSMRDITGQSLLHRAVVHTRSEMVSRLISKGCSLDDQDDGGNTALHLAATNGDREIMSRLLVAGAAPNLYDGEGTSPLHRAVSENKFELIPLLICSGADVGLANAANQTAFHLAASKGLVSICETLARFPTGLPSKNHIAASHEQIFTALLCMRRYVKLPKDIIFIIFCSCPSLIHQLSTLLLLSFNKLLRERSGKISITNDTEWRLRISYKRNGKDFDFIIVPHECTVLDSGQENIEAISASLYGKMWKMCQYAPIDLLKGLKSLVNDNKADDLDIVINGGHMSITQFLEPFNVEHKNVATKMSEPVSLIPSTFLILDAFPSVKYKIEKEGLKEIPAYSFLGLPQDASQDSIEAAYKRLIGLWEFEKCAHAECVEFINTVLKILDSAYKKLSFGFLEEDLEAMNFDLSACIRPHNEKKDPVAFLKQAFLMKKPLSRDVLIEFFKGRSIELQQQFLSIEDNQGHTPAECALFFGYNDLAALLSPEAYERNFGNYIGSCIRAAFYYGNRATQQQNSPLDEAIQRTISQVRRGAAIVAFAGGAVVVMGTLPVQFVAEHWVPGINYSVMYNFHKLIEFISGMELDFSY